MQVPIRKPGKYTHQIIDAHITAEKFNELKSKLEKLKNFSRIRASEEVKRLASDGDFSENAAYQMAKGRLRGINQRILYIEDLLKRAEIIQTDRNNSRVQLGSIITVEINGKIKIYKILGPTETNPSAGIISHISPLGSALINRRVGEVVKVNLADRAIQYKIIKIE